MSSFIATEDFNALLKVMQWSELPQNIIYRIEEVKEVEVDSTTAAILHAIDERGNATKVWAPQILYNDLQKFH